MRRQRGVEVEGQAEWEGRDRMGIRTGTGTDMDTAMGRRRRAGIWCGIERLYLVSFCSLIDREAEGCVSVDGY